MRRLYSLTCDSLIVGLSIRQDKTTVTRATVIACNNLAECVASHRLAITYTDL